MKKYICYLYADYHKDVALQHLRIFSNKAKAVAFATKYAVKSRRKSPAEYVCIRGTVFDAPFLSSDPDEERVNDDNYEELVKECKEKYKEAKEELKIKPSLWYTRIAVDAVEEEEEDN